MIAGSFIPVQRKVGLRGGIETTLRANASLSDRDPIAMIGTNPLVPLRRFGGTAALDLGFDLFRAQAKVLISIATALFLPIQLLDLFLRLTTRRPSGASAFTTSGFALGVFGPMSGFEPFILVLQSVALSLLGVASGVLTAAMMESQTMSAGAVFRRTMARFWIAPLIVAFSAIVYGLGSFLPLLGWAIAGGLTFTASIAAGVEGLGPWRAVRRAMALGGHNLTRAVGLYLGGLIILYLTRLVLLGGPLGLLALLGAPEQLINIVMESTAIVLVIVAPLTAAMASAAYVSMRVSSEGIDLAARIRALDPSEAVESS